MYQVGMGTAVSAALLKGEMGVFIVIYRISSEGCDLIRQKVGVIRNFDTLLQYFPASAGFFFFFIEDIYFLQGSCSGIEDRVLIRQLLPLKTFIFSIYTETFRITPGNSI